MWAYKFMEGTIHPITPHTHTELKFNREMCLCLLFRKYKFDFPQYRASQVVLVAKNSPASEGDKRLGFHSWIGKIPWSRSWQPTPKFLPGKFHRQRSLVGSSSWGHKESDKTEGLNVTPGSTVCTFSNLNLFFESSFHEPRLSKEKYK